MSYENGPVGNVQLMKKMNRLKVLNYIREKHEVSRPEISKYTGLSPSSVTNIVNYLMGRKLVCEGGRVPSKDAGRKAALIMFNSKAFTILGVNIDQNAVTVALTDLNGGIMEKEKLDLPQKPSSDDIFSTVKRGIDGMMDNKSSQNMVAAGIALSGLVLEDGRMEISTTFELRSLPFKEYFERVYKMPVYVQNNSRTKALGVLDQIGGTDDDRIVFLDLVSGVGMVSIENMKINDSIVGEIGHTTVEKDGPKCFCGNRGCLEVMLSMDYILSKYKEICGEGDNRNINYDHFIQALNHKDEKALKVVKNTGEYLGIGMANIINLFYPHKIVIDSREILQWKSLYKRAITVAKERAYTHFVRDLEFIKVMVDDDTAIKGISLYVADKVFDLMTVDALFDH